MLHAIYTFNMIVIGILLALTVLFMLLGGICFFIWLAKIAYDELRHEQR